MSNEPAEQNEPAIPPFHVFCAVQATGRGHLSRFAVAKDLLEAAGARVYGYASGAGLPTYARGIDRFDEGPTFFARGNRVHIARSAGYNLRRAVSFYRAIGSLRALMRERRFDRAIVDFEPLGARAAAAEKLPLTLFDNQTLALLPPAALGLAEVSRELGFMRLFAGFYYGPALRRAERIVTYSMMPPGPATLRAARPGQILVPPCVRREVAALKPTHGGHLLYYSSVGGVPPGLRTFAAANPSVEIRAYVADAPPAHDPPPANVVLPPRDSPSFLDDFASCRAYLTGAGFESVAEAVTLGKPLVIVPIAGQWEQRINAAVVRRHGVGLTADDWSPATFERALRHEAPPSSEVAAWVGEGRDRLRDALVR